MISRRQLLTLGAATAGSAVLGAADAFAIEPGFSLAVRHWSIAHPNWPKSAKPLRIGVLTDIHAVEPWMPASRIAAIARRMNALKPDLIVLLGDYVCALRRGLRSAIVPVAAWTEALKELRAPLGIYAVLGNHDLWSAEDEPIRHRFKEAGFRLLENAAIPLNQDGRRFWIAGLGDQLEAMDDLPGTLRQIGDTSPTILLAHEPNIFKKVPKQVTLTLSGHTHGGQVYLPFIGRPAIPPQYANYAYGHIERGGRHMIVSSGLGVTGFPVRFLVPPEIAIVTLRHRESTKET
jgi:predicted MPP superfamily phosphohydrolase